MENKTTATVALFGGIFPWSSTDWTDSDDRVRGGKSQSYLDCAGSRRTATFRGTLDTSALGVAGFASQRTTGEQRVWELDAFDGILLDVESTGDGKRYTFILKDEILPRSPDGREQSSVSWEYDFELGGSGGDSDDGGEKIFIPWAKFEPTYRGRKVPDARKLDLKNIKRMSIMMRSFFAQQQGDFSLTLRSISATKDLDGTTIKALKPSYQKSELSFTDSMPEKVSSESKPDTAGCLQTIKSSCSVL